MPHDRRWAVGVDCRRQAREPAWSPLVHCIIIERNTFASELRFDVSPSLLDEVVKSTRTGDAPSPRVPYSYSKEKQNSADCAELNAHVAPHNFFGRENLFP
jgi:hypothetical protein